MLFIDNNFFNSGNISENIFNNFFVFIFDFIIGCLDFNDFIVKVLMEVVLNMDKSKIF